MWIPRRLWGQGWLSFHLLSLGWREVKHTAKGWLQPTGIGADAAIGWMSAGVARPFNYALLLAEVLHGITDRIIHHFAGCFVVALYVRQHIVVHVYPGLSGQVAVARHPHPRGDRAGESGASHLQLPCARGVISRRGVISLHLASDSVDPCVANQGHLIVFKGEVNVENHFSNHVHRAVQPKTHRTNRQPSETGANPTTTETGRAWLK